MGKKDLHAINSSAGAYDVPPEAARKAALVVCANARDAADARLLLDNLGLIEVVR